MKVLYLDCFSGISGDMLVGAFCDLGVKPSALEWELSKLELGDFHMHFERAQRQKIEGVHFSIHEGATHLHEASKAHGHHTHEHEHEHEHEREHEHEHDHEPEHEHGHGDEIRVHAAQHEYEHAHQHQRDENAALKQREASSAKLPHDNDSDHGTEVAHAHARHAEEHSHSHEHHEDCCGHAHGKHEHSHVHGRTHREIRALIEASHLSEFVKKHALGIFQRIAVAEGKIHGMAAENVHFHEVGALDSIADIVCSCVGLESLGVDQVLVSRLHEGRGWIDCAHGRFPLPAPATLEILSGIPIGETDETHELITPTGAAFIAEFAASSGPMPRMVIEKIGYGVGSRDLASRPNVLRAVLGKLAEE